MAAHQPRCYYQPRTVRGNPFGRICFCVCLSVCLRPVRVRTFECLGLYKLRSRYTRYVFATCRPRPGSSIKVMRSRSRSYERLKSNPVLFFCFCVHCCKLFMVMIMICIQQIDSARIQGGPKNLHNFCTSPLYQILSDFKNYFTVRIRRKFVIILSLKIPPHLKCVATLPCEM